MSDGDEMNKAQCFGLIVYRLMTDSRGWEIKELCETLELSERTWRNYRKDLMALEPFHDDSGSRVEEVTVGERRYLRLRQEAVPMTGASSKGFRERLVAMQLARQMFGHLRGTSLGDEVTVVLDHLEKSFTDVSAIERAMRGIHRKLYVVDGARLSYDKQEDIIAELVKATLIQRVIDVTYNAGWSGETSPPREALLEPLSLVSSRGALYVLARVHKESAKAGRRASVRTYSLERFERVKVTEEKFQYPTEEAFNPESFFEGEFGIFQRNKALRQHVELLFADVSWLKVFLQARTWHKTQRFINEPDGRLRMTFTVSGMDSVWPWIRSFGHDVEVVSPTGPMPMTHDAQRAWRKEREES